jgi:hypothetical protein
MKTYQIGNKVTCIIRSFCPSTIGDVETQYNNEPYTILKDVSVSMTFSDVEKNARDGQKLRQLNYDMSALNQVRISNVHLTNKVLGMLFTDYENGLKSHYDAVETDDTGHVYLSVQDDKIYQVFIYNEDEEMVQAYGEIAPEEILLTPEKNYLIVYQTLGNKSLKLNSPNNMYYTLDFICEGNTDEVTAPTYIHIQKAGMRTEKSLYFSRNLNAVDLTFNVIKTEDDYIVLD